VELPGKEVLKRSKRIEWLHLFEWDTGQQMTVFIDSRQIIFYYRIVRRGSCSPIHYVILAQANSLLKISSVKTSHSSVLYDIQIRYWYYEVS
jgi:hypothetical protein